MAALKQQDKVPFRWNGDTPRFFELPTYGSNGTGEELSHCIVSFASVAVPGKFHKPISVALRYRRLLSAPVDKLSAWDTDLDEGILLLVLKRQQPCVIVQPCGPASSLLRVLFETASEISEAVSKDSRRRPEERFVKSRGNE